MPQEHWDHHWERTKGEDEYFHKADAVLIDKLRRRATLEEERRLLANASGINDQQILEDLERLGFNRETVILLHLVPLVQVAWSSGSVTRRERELVLQAARVRGVSEGTPAHRLLVGWLNERPPEAFFRSSLHIIRMILQTLPPAERKAATADLIRCCNQIASASRSLLGFGPRICAGEKRLLSQIVEELAQEHEAAARQVVAEVHTEAAPRSLALRLFKKILLVVHQEGDQEGALKRTVALARTNQALLTLAGVYRPSPRYVKSIIPGAGGEPDLDAVVRQAVENRVEDLVAAASHEGIAVERKLLRGTPFVEVIREVVRNNHDLVITAAEGEVGLQKTSFGTTILKLLRECPCPVWVMKGKQQGRYARILAAIDLDPSNEESVALNHKIMNLAISAARADLGDLHVIQTWTVQGMDSLPELRVFEDNKRIRQQWLSEFVRQHPLDDLQLQVHLLEGEAGTVIPEIVASHAIDLIVMGALGRTSVRTMGRTAEKVFARLDCSVLAVKPDGFTTPVMMEAA